MSRKIDIRSQQTILGVSVARWFCARSGDLDLLLLMNRRALAALSDNSLCTKCDEVIMPSLSDRVVISAARVSTARRSPGA